MLLRCMMIVFLFMISVMPAWAGEKDVSPTTTTAEQMTMEEALSKITIESEDWIDGDTYYIRYTFINPTDVKIDKQVDLTTVTYDLCYTENQNETVIQCTDDISQLVIAPHDSFTTTISLSQPDLVVFNNLNSCTFYFYDGSYIYYSNSHEQTDSLFSLSPFIDSDNKVYLSIQNNSFFNTITEVSNIRLNFNIYGQRITSFYAGPIPLTIPPKETQMIYLSPLINPINKDISDYHYDVSIKINDVPHIYHDQKSSFSDLFSYQINSDSPSKKTFRAPFKAYYYPFTPRIMFKDGSFYHDDSYLYAFVQVYSHSDQTISIPNTTYHMLLSYFNDNNFYQAQHFNIHLPYNFTIAPNENKYFTFKVPLPPDFSRLKPNFYPFFSTDHPKLNSQTLFPIEQLSLPVPKENYTILEDVSEK